MASLFLDEQSINLKGGGQQLENEKVYNIDLDKEEELQLPKLIPINVDALVSENTKLLEPELLDPISEIHKKVYSKFMCYDAEGLRNFKFNLPNTLLPPKRQIATFISPLREGSHEDEDLYSKGLSRLQLKDIWNTGTFHVKSKLYPQDYIFQLNSWVAKGRNNINATLKRNIDSVFKELYKIKYRFSNEKVSGRFGCDMASSLKALFSIPNDMFFLLFGSPWIMFKKTDRSKEMEEARIAKLFHDKNVDRELHRYINEGSFIVHCTRWEREFLYDVWPQEKIQFEKQLIQDKDSFSKNMAETQNQQLIKYVEKQSFALKDKFVSFIKASVILMEKDYEFTISLNQKEKELKASIPKQHWFKSKFPQWLDKITKKELGKYKKNLRNEKNKEIVAKLEIFPKEKYLFEKYLEYLKDLPFLREQDRRQSKREVKAGIQYKKVFSIKFEKINCSGNEEINTEAFRPDHYFWKVNLLLKRINSNTRHFFLYFYTSAVFGHFGIKRLIMLKKFESPEAEQPRSPIWLEFHEVIRSIEIDRKKFENSRDDGFMPKSCSRIANLVYNYLFKFILVGIAYVLIFQAALIVFISTILFFLAFTAFMWAPVTTVVMRLGNIILFDPDTETEGLLLIIYRFAILFVLQFLLSIVGMLGHIIIAILLFIIAFIRFFIENVYYGLMMILVCCLGRVPGNDTSIAWKIQSPFKLAGFNYKYLKMELQDILYLVLVYLEKQELDKYSNAITNSIAEPKFKLSAFLDRVQKQIKMNLYSDEPRLLKEQVNSLKNRLNSEIQSRYSLFPNIDKFKNSIKLTSKELEHTQQSVAQYLNDLASIKNIDFLWPRADIQRGDFLKLADFFLENIFGKSIFSPLENTEARTNLLVSRAEEFTTLFTVMRKMPDSMISVGSMKNELALDLSLKASTVSYPLFKLSKISEAVPINEETPYEFSIRLKIVKDYVE